MCCTRKLKRRTMSSSRKRHKQLHLSAALTKETYGDVKQTAFYTLINQTHERCLLHSLNQVARPMMVPDANKKGMQSLMSFVIFGGVFTGIFEHQHHSKYHRASAASPAWHVSPNGLVRAGSTNCLLLAVKACCTAPSLNPNWRRRC